MHEHKHLTLEEAERIVAEIIRKHKLHRDDFFGWAKQDYLVKARIEAARRLYDTGFRYAEMEKALHRSQATIARWLDKTGDRNRSVTTLPVPDEAKAIVRDTIKGFDLTEEDFFGKDRHPRCVDARSSAATRMHGKGLSLSTIARAIGRDRHTVMYYLDGGVSRAVRYFRKHGRLALSRLTFCESEYVAKAALERRMQPLDLICSWVSERIAIEKSANNNVEQEEELVA